MSTIIAYNVATAWSFQWDKQPRSILRFPSGPFKAKSSIWTSWLFVSCQSEFIPRRLKHSRSATLGNWRVSCRGEWLTGCTSLLHYVLMLCPYAPVFALTCKQNRDIQYSSLLCLGIDPLLFTDAWLHCFSVPLSSVPVLLQQTDIPLSVGHLWGWRKASVMIFNMRL